MISVNADDDNARFASIPFRLESACGALNEDEDKRESDINTESLTKGLYNVMSRECAFQGSVAHTPILIYITLYSISRQTKKGSTTDYSLPPPNNNETAKTSKMKIVPTTLLRKLRCLNTTQKSAEWAPNFPFCNANNTFSSLFPRFCTTSKLELPSCLQEAETGDGERGAGRMHRHCHSVLSGRQRRRSEPLMVPNVNLPMQMSKPKLGKSYWKKGSKDDNERTP